jgi:hypothetical protein
MFVKEKELTVLIKRQTPWKCSLLTLCTLSARGTSALWSGLDVPGLEAQNLPKGLLLPRGIWWNRGKLGPSGI